MKRVYLSWLMVTLFSLTSSMYRDLSEADLNSIQEALAGCGIVYNRENMPTIKKPLMPHAEVNYNKTLFLINLSRKQVMLEYAIHERPTQD